MDPMHNYRQDWFTNAYSYFVEEFDVEEEPLSDQLLFMQNLVRLAMRLKPILAGSFSPRVMRINYCLDVIMFILLKVLGLCTAFMAIGMVTLVVHVGFSGVFTVCRGPLQTIAIMTPAIVYVFAGIYSLPPYFIISGCIGSYLILKMKFLNDPFTIVMGIGMAILICYVFSAFLNAVTDNSFKKVIENYY